ncbi:MAG: hypothetical protein QG564_237 [Campylobacterota bacterium]|nr:hypothetical protein [Campylobacterota bacterium]
MLLCNTIPHCSLLTTLLQGLTVKNVGLTISGKRYEIRLEDDFADFINRDLKEAGVELHKDNAPDKLLKAYLRLAKQATSYEEEIELLIETLEGL